MNSASTPTNSVSTPTQDEAIHLYRKMVLIRTTELCFSSAQKNGELAGPVHLYIGEEATAVGICSQLDNHDWITSTHRGHGHYLAKGGDLKGIIYEVYGKAGGICKGKGGSMHVADISKGILGANGIVGAGISLATGAALTSQLNPEKQGVAVAFFGDGASNQGVLMESFNTAKLWNLPLIYVCENNGFSQLSPTKSVTYGKIGARAEAFDIPTISVDGNNLLEVMAAAEAAVKRAKNNEGPSFIEAVSYRIHGHVEFEDLFISKPYRSPEEIEEWKAKDPIGQFRQFILDKSYATNEELNAIAKEIEDDVEAIKLEAKTADWPEDHEAKKNMLTGEIQ